MSRGTVIKDLLRDQAEAGDGMKNGLPGAQNNGNKSRAPKIKAMMAVSLIC